MAEPVAVVVDPYSSGNLLAPALRKVGVVPVAVRSTDRPPEVYASSYRPGNFDSIIVHNGLIGETVERLRALAPVCVLAGTECGVELADQLAAVLTPERANNPALAAARRHKAAMGAAVAAAGLPAMRQVCTADAAEVTAWIERAGLRGRDLVVKPPNSAGSDGVTHVRAGVGWPAAFGRLLGERNKLGLVNDEVLVQEYLTGTEYVVDTCTFDGVHAVVDICRYRKLHIAGQMAVYDYMEWLPYDTAGHTELLAFATGVLDAVGVRFGAAHTEIMMTAGGPRLIEVNARIAGAGVPRFCQEATGDNQVDRLARYCAGDRAFPAGFALRRRVRGVLFVARTSGVLRNADEYQQVRSLPSHYDSVINVRSGDHVTATRDLFSSHALGYVILAHDRPEQVQADYDMVRQIEKRLVFDRFH